MHPTLLLIRDAHVNELWMLERLLLVKLLLLTYFLSAALLRVRLGVELLLLLLLRQAS